VADQQGDLAENLAARLGVSLPEGGRERLARFWSLLLTWNARINLTGARTEAALVGDHLPDSLAMLRLLSPGAHLIDVGSGGGLPALPYALLRPEDPITLVEPRTKRAAFLRTAVRELGLTRVVVLGARIEDAPAEGFEVASSRATFAPVEWLEKARRLAPRALVFAARAADVLAPAGWELEGEVTYQAGAGQPRWVGRYCST
jgi:16S rRNA (guanine527-N7)-methyltransferase